MLQKTFPPNQTLNETPSNAEYFLGMSATDGGQFLQYAHPISPKQAHFKSFSNEPKFFLWSEPDEFDPSERIQEFYN